MKTRFLTPKTATTALVAAAVFLLMVAISPLTPLRSALAVQGSLCVSERQALPESEPELVTNTAELNGTNWMSGISGTRYLNEINIPGTHDSSMWDPVAAHSAMDLFGGSYAKTQNKNMDFPQQLNAGVRLFDLRLTNVYPRGGGSIVLSFLQDESVMTWGKQGLYFVHGKHNGLKGDWRFYAENKGEKTTVFQMDQALLSFTLFLAAQPTETLILDVSRESDSGDKEITLRRLEQYLKQYGSRINPSTGKPFIYTEDGSTTNYTVSKMPQLSECRGQFVVISTDGIDVGIPYGWTGGHTSTHFGGSQGIDFYSENHFEETRDEKVKRIQEHLSHYDYLSALPRDAMSAPLAYGAKMSTGSNRPAFVTPDPHQNPEEIAKVVNEKCYGENGILRVVGAYYGWVYSDFVTNDTVRNFWLTNFPKNLDYSTIRYTANVNGTTKTLKTTKVLTGTTITLPSNMESSLSADVLEGFTIMNWEIDQNGLQVSKEFGETLKVNGSMAIQAHLERPWSSIQEAFDNAKSGDTITLDTDITARSSDSKLKVMSEDGDSKVLTLNLNGHTINRNAVVATEDGSCMWVGPAVSLTIVGPGTITGGKSWCGGGIWVQPGAMVGVKDGVRIEGNEAERTGGGVFAGDAYGWYGINEIPTAHFSLMSGSTITCNFAMTGGGIYCARNSMGSLENATVESNTSGFEGGVVVANDTIFTVSGAAKITENTLTQKTSATPPVYVAANLYMKSKESLDASGLTDGAQIGVTMEIGPVVGQPSTFTRAFTGDAAAAKSIFTSDSEDYSIGLEEANKVLLHSKSTVKFDTGHVITPSSQLVHYGQTATKPDDPTWPALSFDHWYLLGDKTQAEFDFSKPITQNTTLCAKWNMADVEVVFDAYPGTFTSGGKVSKTIEFNGTVTAPEEKPTREGYTFSHWKIASNAFSMFSFKDRTLKWTPFDFSQQITHNTTIRAEWTPNQCTVTFDSNGGSEVSSQSVTSGTTVTKPQNPTKEYATFAGWYYADDSTRAFDFNSWVTGDVALRAKWIPVNYNVTFRPNGGTNGSWQRVAHGSCVEEPAQPERPGYEFDGWCIDVEGTVPFDLTTPITRDLYVYAKWVKSAINIVTFSTSAEEDEADTVVLTTAENSLAVMGAEDAATTRTVTFLSNGEEYASKTVTAGQYVLAPDEPEREGYLFAGWYKNEQCTVPFDFSVPVTQDATAYAKWVSKLYNVTFVQHNGLEDAVVSVESGACVSALDPKPTLDNCTFGGWYADEQCTTEFDFSQPITDDAVAYAKWNVDVVFMDGTAADSAVLSTQTVERFCAAAKPADPTKEGCTFGGWFLEVDPSELSDEELASIAEALEQDSVLAQHLWLDGTTLRVLYDFDAEVPCDTTLYARWISNEHTVTFYANGGAFGTASTTTASVADGNVVSAPATAPTREGYTFVGWYTDEECTEAYQFKKPVQDDVILYAKWEAHTYAVQFVTNGGTAVSTQVVEHGSKATKPEVDPTMRGYVFAGWYADASFTKEFDFDAAITGSKTVYAKWEDDTTKITVTFDATGGENAPASQSVDKYAIPTKPTTDPTKANCTFLGWYVQIDDEVDQELIDAVEDDPELAEWIWIEGTQLRALYDFDLGFESDVTLYARWDQDERTVTFVDEDVIGEVAVYAGDAVPEPEIYAREGYQLAGWTANKDSDQLYDFNTPVTKDLTLYALWSPEYVTVSFNSEGGSTTGLEPQQVTFLGTASEPADPTKQNCTFAGWYEDLGAQMTDEQLSELTDAYPGLGDILWRTESTTMLKHDLSEEKLSYDLNLHARWIEGSLTSEVIVQDGAPGVTSSNLRDALLATLTSDEIAQGAYTWLQVSPLTEQTVPAADKTLADAYVSKNGLTTGAWFDMSLYKRIGGEDAEAVAIHETAVPVKISLEVPEALRNTNDNVTRTFYLLRVHDGKVSAVASGTGTTLEGESDRFSTYVLAYSDAVAASSAASGSGTTAYKTPTARTGDATSWLGFVCAALAGLIAVAVGKRLAASRE